jgi:uncharacterized protein (TIGR02284 family)
LTLFSAVRQIEGEPVVGKQPDKEKRGTQMADQKVVRTLQQLYQIVDAGERGFATAAANMPDPGLKILLKLYAQQRLTFKNEIYSELNRLGANVRPETSFPGAVHRGRVAIFAGLSDRAGQERTIINESALGERVAVRTYQKTLERDLPQETRDLVERQYTEVKKTSDLIHCLRDDEKRRAVVHLAESEQDTRRAVQALVRAGFGPDEIETTKLEEQHFYEGRGATLTETVLSGAVGGALWGGVTGILAGLGVVQTTDLAVAGTIFLTWLLTSLGFLLVGA